MSNTLNKNNLVKLTEFEMKNLSNTHAISSLDVYKDISTGEYYQWDGGYKKLQKIPNNNSSSNIENNKYLVIGGVVVAIVLAIGITIMLKRPVPAAVVSNSAEIIGGSEAKQVLGNVFNKVISAALALISTNNQGKAQEKFHSAGDCECTPKDPIIFDLNNDGVLETTDINNGIYFDHENDGFAESSAWVGDNDGILVIDSNNNGDIDNGSELLTAETLASFDTNEDGIIDENDTNFANLKILKSDGTLMTLTEAGITSINLNTTSTEITDKNGNQQFASGTFTRADGTTGTFGEFLVKTETSNSIATEWLDETDEISDLPDISGSGNIYSLHQAMLRDESGELVA